MASNSKSESKTNAKTDSKNITISGSELVKNTKVLNLNKINPNNIILGTFFAGTLGGKSSGKPQGKSTSLSYYNIPVYYKGEDGKIQYLLFKLGKCFTFGIQKNTLGDKGDGFPYNLSCVLYGRDGASEDEKERHEGLINLFNGIKEVYKNYKFPDNKDIIPSKTLKEMLADQKDERLLNNIHTSVLKEPSDKQPSPILNLKLMDKNEKDAKTGTYVKKITSHVYSGDNNTKINPLDFLNKPANCNSFVLVDKISFTVKGPKVQLKIWDVKMNFIESSGKKSFLLEDDNENMPLPTFQNPISSYVSSSSSTTTSSSSSSSTTDKKKDEKKQQEEDEDEEEVQL